jgi:hypothetical protein
MTTAQSRASTVVVHWRRERDLNQRFKLRARRRVYRLSWGVKNAGFLISCQRATVAYVDEDATVIGDVTLGIQC